MYLWLLFLFNWLNHRHLCRVKHMLAGPKNTTRPDSLLLPLSLIKFKCLKGPSWSWSYGGWIYKYLCNRCLSPLELWVRKLLRRSVLDTTLCDKVSQWLATGQWFSPGTPVSPTNKTWFKNKPIFAKNYF
jgi:hypothetical protein